MTVTVTDDNTTLFRSSTIQSTADVGQANNDSLQVVHSSRIYGNLTQTALIVDANGRVHESASTTTFDAAASGGSESTSESGSSSSSSSNSDSRSINEAGDDPEYQPESGSSNGAADAALVGVMGVMTLAGAGAASGASSAGAAGASAASASASAGAGAGTSAGTGIVNMVHFFTQFVWLRYLRPLYMALPWELLPISIFKYSRYDDSDPLENDRRRTIYRTVEDDPGAYLSAVSETSDVPLSTVRHHVRVLEEEGLVTSVKVHGKRRYFPAGEDDVELHAALAEPSKRGVLEALADHGRANNGDLATALDRDPSTVSHHLSTLEDDGLVVREKDGRAIVNELAPEVYARLLEDEDEGETDDSQRAVAVPADD
ncbi:metalloregulator ArsR/SmtB family transcription factor [Halomontanus rarus]|uniref:metalloregulator ArsR/SmtB family transcription factor n=1 Tax=Halomontanus rarus TaxID=3034020 RepID=UPI001A99F136